MASTKWRFGWIAAIVVLVAQIGWAQKSEADGFIYLRRISDGNRIITDSVVLSRITETGFEQQTIYSGQNLTTFFRPLDVISGKFYGVARNGLTVVDLASGAVSQAAQTMRTGEYAYFQGKLYFRVVEPEPVGPVIRVIDLATLSFSNVVSVPNGIPPGTLVLSPNGKRLAYAHMPSPDVIDLHFVNLEAKTHKSYPGLAYQQPIYGGGGYRSSALLVWRDDNTILTVTNNAGVGRRTPAGPGGEMLVAIDADTLHLSRLDPFPQPNSLIQMTAAAEPGARSVILTTGRGSPAAASVTTRYAFNAEQTSIIEGSTQIGAFKLQGGRGHNTPEAVLLDEKVIARAAARPMSVSVSPDGQRLLYLVSYSMDSSALHYFDAKTQTDRVVDRASPDQPYLWFSSEDLKPAPAPPVPEGFRALQVLPAE